MQLGRSKQIGQLSSILVQWLRNTDVQYDLAATWVVELIRRWPGSVEHRNAIEIDNSVQYAEMVFRVEDRVCFYLIYDQTREILDSPLLITVPWVAKIDFPVDLESPYRDDPLRDRFIRRMFMVTICRLANEEVRLIELMADLWTRIRDVAPRYAPPIHEDGRLHFYNPFVEPLI